MKNLDRDPYFILLTITVLLPAMAIIEAILFIERIKHRARHRSHL